MSLGAQVPTLQGNIGFTLYDDGRSISLSLPHDWLLKLTVEEGIKLLLALGMTAKKATPQSNTAGLSCIFLPPTFEAKEKMESLLSRSLLTSCCES